MELSTLSRVTTFLVFGAGFATFFAGAQVAWSVSFTDRWMVIYPLGQAAAGLVTMAAGRALAHPKRWALFATLPLCGILAVFGISWAIWSMAHGLFTLLALFSPAWSCLAGLGFLVSLSDIVVVEKIRRAGDLETERLNAEAAAELARGSPDDLPVPPRRRPWLLPLMYVGAALPVLALIATGVWPEKWEAVWARARGVLAGRNPLASGFVSEAQDYPYSGSPVEWYLDYEASWLPVDKLRILAAMDQIADDVSWELVAATGQANPVHAEAALWAAGNQKQLPLWIASAMRKQEFYYNAEALFSRSFDPSLHRGDSWVHLDCDQLVYAFMHVAARLDLAMKAIPSPYHVYLRYDGPAGEAPVFVETTQFRAIDRDGSHVSFDGRTIGEEFFMAEDYYSSGRGGTWASAEITAAAGLYQPWTEKELNDNIVANVLVGVAKLGMEPYPAASEARLPGTRDPMLVTNLYLWYLHQAEDRFDAGDLETTLTMARRAQELRAEFGPLIIYLEPKEEAILAEVAIAVNGQNTP